METTGRYRYRPDLHKEIIIRNPQKGRFFGVQVGFKELGATGESAGLLGLQVSTCRPETENPKAPNPNKTNTSFYAKGRTLTYLSIYLSIDRVQLRRVLSFILQG